MKIIFKIFDINKAHGHDEFSIRMLKQCDKSIVKPPSIIFKNVNLKRKKLWKNANVAPIHKKREKDMRNYCPVSLLPFFGKF